MNVAVRRLQFARKSFTLFGASKIVAPAVIVSTFALLYPNSSQFRLVLYDGAWT